MEEASNNKTWYARIDNVFWRSLLSPFCICFKHKVEFFVWIMFVIFAGQLGTIINIIKRWVFGGWELLPSFGPDSASGSFYTFALVLIASLVAPVFLRFVKKESPEYRNISIVFVTLLIFSLVLCAIFYSFATKDMNSVDFSKLTNGNMHTDWKQLVFFCLSIVFAWYSFGLSLSPSHEADLKLDYQELDDKTREGLSGTLKPNKPADVDTSKADATDPATKPVSNPKYQDLKV